MSDTLISPLAQAAGGGNDIQTQAFQQLLSQGEQKQNYLQQQQAAYNSEMENYANMVKQSQVPQSNDSGRWGAIASAAGRFAPTWGNIAPGIAATGGAAASYDQTQQAENLKNQYQLTKMRQDEVRALEAKDQNNSLLRAMGRQVTTGGKANWIQFKDDAGNLHLMDKSQGPSSEVVIPATQNATWLKLLAQGKEIAIRQDEPDKDQYALDYATRLISTFKPGVAAQSTAQPATVTVGQPPVGESSAPAPEGIGPETGPEGSVSVTPSLTQMLSPQDRAIATRLVARINANPSAAQNDMNTLAQIVAKYDERGAKPAPVLGGTIASAAGRKVAAEEAARTEAARSKKTEEAIGSGEGKQVVEAPEKKAALDNYLAESTQTVELASSLLKHPGLAKASGLEGYVPGRGRILTMAATDSAEFMAKLKTLESRITSLALQSARTGSASGATGFGALDKGEREMLRDSIASMDLSQSPKALSDNLRKIIDVVSAAEARAKAGYARTYKKSDTPEAPLVDGADAEYQAWKAKRGVAK